MVLRQSPGGSTLERALRALEKMEAKLIAAERAKSEPLAIIGMGCRFPGGARNPAALWHVLHAGINAVTEVPAHRWRQSSAPQSAARWAGLLENVDQFDGPFFGLSRQDVADMDPQHRLLLEVAWETLENAGVTPARLSANKTGVFLGISSHEYHTLLAQSAVEARPYVITGNAASFAASRIAYLLGLRGPALSIDTACSSALVALHVACQSLRRGECDMALVGGVNLLLSPETSNLLASLQILSPDGQCRTFDARANGYVRAEGAGFVLLERASDAVAKRDRTLALIRGSAVNQNGRATSMTAPSIQAQVAVIRAALQDAHVSAEQLGYLEAHSNGSPLGDSVEIDALREALGQPRKDGSRCVLGSVKSCIGHAEAASGMASIIKAVLVLGHGVIPRNLHFESLNPNSSIDGTPFVIPTHAMVWKKGTAPRFAGVSATGLSGTNVHVILQEPVEVASQTNKPERLMHLCVLSAKNSAALQEHAKQMQRHLTAHPELSLGDLCHTLGFGRTHFEHRFAVVAGSNAELTGQLTDFIDGAPGTYVTAKVQSLSARRRVAFIFPGNVEHLVGSVGPIDAAPPVFADAIRHADNAVLVMTGMQVAPLLEGGSDAFFSNDPVTAELALFVLQYALVETWRAWGFEPAVIAGEGIGECAAAWAAGMLEFADALSLAIARARLAHSRKRDTNELRRVLPKLVFNSSNCLFLPSMGEAYSSVSLASWAYWERQVAARHDWNPILVGLASEGYEVALEMAPAPVASAHRLVNRRESLPTLSPLRAAVPIFRSLLETLAHLYVSGFDLNWQKFDEPHPYRRIDAPTYPFQRQRYWIATTSTDGGVPTVEREGHALLGRVLDARADQPDVRSWEMTLDDVTCRSVGVQKIATTSVLSSGGIVEVAGAAVREIMGNSPWELSLTLGDPPVLDDDTVATMQVVATPQGDSKVGINIFFRARAGISWKRAALGVASVAKPTEDIEEEVAPASIRAGRRQSLPLALWGHRLETLGVHTDAFHIEQIWRREGETLARVSLKTPYSPRSVVRTAVAIASITRPALYGRSWMVESTEGLLMKETAPETGAWLRMNWSSCDGLSARIGVELVDDDGCVVATARHIELRAQDQAALLRAAGQDPLDSALVELSWKEVPLLQSARPRTKRKWFILTDRSGFGDELAAQLRATGDSVITLPAAEVERSSEKLDITLLVSGPFFGVIHLGALDAPSNDAIETSNLDATLIGGAATLLRVVQSLAALVYVPRLWLVTRGAQGIENPEPSIAQAGLWGLGRVISMERPDMWGGMIDVGPLPEPDQVASLVQALDGLGSDNHIALRGAKTYVARLARFGAPEEHAVPVRPDRSYLVTGASTPLGEEVVRWLVDRGARNLIFASWFDSSRPRPENTSDAQREYANLVSSLQSKNVRTAIVEFDLLDPHAVHRTLARIATPIAAVLHVAGASEHRISRLTSHGAIATLCDVLRNKSFPLWALHLATAKIPLDFFVAFASVPAALGWEGFAPDAISCAYANCISRIRSMSGRPSISLHLAFANEPRPGQGELDQELLAVGFQGMSASNALDAIDRLIYNQKPIATLAWADWNLLECAGRMDNMRPLLEGLADGRSTRVGPAMLQRRVAAADPEQARKIIENVVRGELLHVLGGGPGFEVANDQDFASLGMDSIMAVQVLTRVGRVCGVNLPVTILLTRPTLNLLTERLLRTMRPDVLSADGELPSGPFSRRGSIVEFNRDGKTRPIFFAPPLTGSGLFFQPLVSNLSPDRPFCAFETPGLDIDSIPAERVEILAGRFVDEMRQKQPRGPYLLGGYSFGVLIAFEMAQILVRAGERVAALILVDLPPPRHGIAKLTPLAQVARLFNYSIDEDTFDDLEPDEQAARMTFLSKARLNLPPDIAETAQQMRVYQAHLRALQAYVPQRYNGPVTLIRSHETIKNSPRAGFAPEDKTLGWGALCSQSVNVHDLPGDHFTVLLQPELARLLQAMLDATDAM